jgi:hypothetical protein
MDEIKCPSCDAKVPAAHFPAHADHYHKGVSVATKLATELLCTASGRGERQKAAAAAAAAAAAKKVFEGVMARK